MNIEEFCTNFSLGKVKNITKLTGGLMHKMYKVETETKTYAIKVLNPEVMRRQEAFNNFIVSEKVSNYVSQHGISVSSAIQLNGNYVVSFGDSYYMVFQFIDGRVLKDDEISVEMVRKIGRILAQIHSLDYGELGFDGEIQKDYFYVDWKDYIKYKNFNKMKYKDEYLNNYKKYYSILKRSVERFNESNTICALCHRDMDPKNVMWVDDNPVIIDWESASVSNPYREVLEDALSWSGFLSNQFSEEKFRAMFEEYVKVHKIETDRYSLICGNLIGRFGWLDYNLKRSLGIKSNDLEEMKLAEEEVVKTIDEIHRYLELIPVMYRIVCDLTKEESHKYDHVVKKIINSSELLQGLQFERINVGFSNTIYKVGDFILRLCTDLENEDRFMKEVHFYNQFSNYDFYPKCLVSDISKSVVPYFYEVIEFVPGKTLYEIWYKIDENEREEIVRKIIDVIKPLHEYEVDTCDFKAYIKKQINKFKHNEIIESNDLEILLAKCDVYFEQNKIGLLHADLHFDNFIYNDNSLYLIDFERCMVGAIDYDFRIFNRYNEEPWKWASAKTDMITVEDDYSNLMNYFIENYETLREIPYLEKRLKIYKLLDYFQEYEEDQSEENLNKVTLLLKEIIN